MHELPLESTAFFRQKMLQLNREARACILKQRKYDPDNLCGTQLLRIKASQQKKERSLQHISMKLGLVFLWAPLKLCQFTPAEKPPLRSSLPLCLTNASLLDLSSCPSERLITLLIQNGTLDLRTGCEAVMLPAPALFSSHLNVLPHSQNCKHLCSRNKGTQTGGGSEEPPTTLFGLWAPELGSAAPQKERPFIAARLGFSILKVKSDE